MIRKLWLELRLGSLLLLVFLILLTLEYTWFFQHTSIMALHDHDGYSLVMSPTADQKEIASFLKEHPQGQVFSLKETPSSYLAGFDGIARMVLPFMVVLFCAGGILTEKSNGTASFVLSLPISRSSLLWVRAGMLLFLTAGIVFLCCAIAFILGASMGIDHSWRWLVMEPLLLTLGVAPWIGVSTFVQSYLSGRMDPVTESLLAASLTALMVVVTSGIVLWDLPAGLSFLRPMKLLFSGFKASGSDAAWRFLLSIGVVGIGSMLLAIRRFERLDF